MSTGSMLITMALAANAADEWLRTSMEAGVHVRFRVVRTAALTIALVSCGSVGPGLKTKDPLFQAMRETLDTYASTPITRSMIASLSNSELDSRVWLRLSRRFSVSDPRILRRLPPTMRAYLSTRLFEWEVGNGGIVQYLWNYPNLAFLEVVGGGYGILGMQIQQRTVDNRILPAARHEAKRLRSMSHFVDAYSIHALTELDALVEAHDDVRVAFIRSHPDSFVG